MNRALRYLPALSLGLVLGAAGMAWHRYASAPPVHVLAAPLVVSSGSARSHLPAGTHLYLDHRGSGASTRFKFYVNVEGIALHETPGAAAAPPTPLLARLPASAGDAASPAADPPRREELRALLRQYSR